MVVHHELSRTNPNFVLLDQWPLLVARKASANILKRAEESSAAALKALEQKPVMAETNSDTSEQREIAEAPPAPIPPAAAHESSNVIRLNAEFGEIAKQRSELTTEDPGSKDNAALKPAPAKLAVGKANDVNSEYGSAHEATTPIDTTITSSPAERSRGSSNVELPFTKEYGDDIAKFVGGVVRSDQMVHVAPYQRGDAYVDGYTRRPPGGLTFEENFEVAAWQFAAFATVAAVESGVQWYSENKEEIGLKADRVKQDLKSTRDDFTQWLNGWAK